MDRETDRQAEQRATAQSLCLLAVRRIVVVSKLSEQKPDRGTMFARETIVLKPVGDLQTSWSPRVRGWRLPDPVLSVERSWRTIESYQLCGNRVADDLYATRRYWNSLSSSFAVMQTLRFGSAEGTID